MRKQWFYTTRSEQGGLNSLRHFFNVLLIHPINMNAGATTSILCFLPIRLRWLKYFHSRKKCSFSSLSLLVRRGFLCSYRAVEFEGLGKFRIKELFRSYASGDSLNRSNSFSVEQISEIRNTFVWRAHDEDEFELLLVSCRIYFLSITESCGNQQEVFFLSLLLVDWRKHVEIQLISLQMKVNVHLKGVCPWIANLF